MRSSRQIGASAVISVLAAATLLACGGGSDDRSESADGTTATSTADIEPSGRDIGVAVVTHLGPEDGLAGVLFSLDNGYSVEQVVQPEATASNVLFGTATWSSAIRNGTISYDGLDALMDSLHSTQQKQTGAEDSNEATPASDSDEMELRRFAGEFDLSIFGPPSEDEVTLGNGGELAAGNDLAGVLVAYGQSGSPISGGESDQRYCSGFRFTIAGGAVPLVAPSATKASTRWGS